MNHLITSAISLTNQGADKLATGEYFAAASAFCRAIKITQLLAEQQQATNDESSSSSSSSSSDDNDDDECCAWSYEALPVLSADLSSCHNEIAIFEHCFIVTLADKNNTPTTVTAEHCHVFTAALIYNLALTYHYGGLCGNSPARLQDALNLYAKALDLLPDRQTKAETIMTRDGRALLLALCNNAASLSLVLENELLYKECSSRILQQLASSSHANDDDNLDVSFYLRNIAMWEDQMTRHGGLYYRESSTIHNIAMTQQ